jgi:hypothetical protein
LQTLRVTIANINGSKKFVPGGENRAHRPTHKILSADKIKKRWIFPTFSRHGNAQTSLALLIWLNENVLYLLIQLMMHQS